MAPFSAPKIGPLSVPKNGTQKSIFLAPHLAQKWDAWTGTQKKTKLSTQSWTLKYFFLRYRNWSLALAPEQLQATKVLQKINFKTQAFLKDTGGERTPACVEFPRQLKGTARARRSCKKFYVKIYVKAQLDSVGKARGEGFRHWFWYQVLAPKPHQFFRCFSAPRGWVWECFLFAVPLLCSYFENVLKSPWNILDLFWGCSELMGVSPTNNFNF